MVKQFVSVSSVILQKLLSSLVVKATLTLCREKKHHHKTHARQSKANGGSHPGSKTVAVNLTFQLNIFWYKCSKKEETHTPLLLMQREKQHQLCL